MGLELTDRDYDVLRFLSEMRFLSFNQLRERFFKNEEGNGKWYLYKRLKRLREGDLVKKSEVAIDGESHFLITKAGVALVRSRYPDEIFPNPISEIDVRNFAHHKKVIDCRFFLEDMRGATRWKSEAKLKAEKNQTLTAEENRKTFVRGGEDNYPDAMYISSTGARVVFELELTKKAERRIEKKVSGLLSNYSDKADLFLFMCGTNAIIDTYRRVSEGSKRIVLVPLSEISGKCGASV